jgi:hypothetical protein
MQVEKTRGRKKKDDPKITRNNIKKYFSSNLRTKISLDTEELDILCINVKENEEKIYSRDITQESKSIAQESTCNVLSEFRDEWKYTTGIHCWNCSHNFDSTPIGIPVRFTNKKFGLNGIFCGFPCMVRYTIDRHTFTKYKIHIVYMFKVLTGNPPEVLQPAPPVLMLKIFGGKLEIDEYRVVGYTKMFKYVNYPMYISRDYIEEIDLKTIKDANDYVFKNSKSTGSTSRKNIHEFLKTEF